MDNNCEKELSVSLINIDDDGKTSKKTSNKSKVSLITSSGIVSTQISFEVFKQMSFYGVQYLNGGKYPMPQTFIVLLIEILKLLFTIIRLKGNLPSFSSASLLSSIKFLVPGLIYAVNNNIYFYGLTLVSPPIWMILTSVRTVITATFYKLFLGRSITKMQFLGAFAIVSSVIVAKIPEVFDNNSSRINLIPIKAILLGLLSASLSVTAALYTERLFKQSSNEISNGESFNEQQFWLYYYGILVSGIAHFIGNLSYGFWHFCNDFQELTLWVKVLLIFGFLTASLGGLVVAAILKKLDNVVKEYSQQMANIVNAILCSLLFPDKFNFNIYISMSLFSLVFGIYLYESKRSNQ